MFVILPWNVVLIHWPLLYMDGSCFQVLVLAGISVIERALVSCWVRNAAAVCEQPENNKGEKKTQGSQLLRWGENPSMSTSHWMLSQPESVVGRAAGKDTVRWDDSENS